MQTHQFSLLTLKHVFHIFHVFNFPPMWWLNKTLHLSATALPLLSHCSTRSCPQVRTFARRCSTKQWWAALQTMLYAYVHTVLTYRYYITYMNMCTHENYTSCSFKYGLFIEAILDLTSIPSIHCRVTRCERWALFLTLAGFMYFSAKTEEKLWI